MESKKNMKGKVKEPVGARAAFSVAAPRRTVFDKNLTRRNFLTGLAACVAASATPEMFAQAVRLRHDSDLTALISDCHVNGRPGVLEHYQSAELATTIAEILRLDPLPARVVFFGDLARARGCVKDYMLARDLLKPIADAGIKLYLGMGNHDSVKPFLEVFPEYEKLTRIPGEIVFTVDAGEVDFIMLDILAGDKKRDGSCLSTAQQSWLAEALPKWRKPVFVCSHYAAESVKVHGRKLHELLFASSMVAGYIHGHDHYWGRGVMNQNWTSPKLVKQLSLPSTGHWGDIGWALMRTGGGKAKVELRQRDFWFPIKDSPGPDADREMWRLNIAENQGATCTFTLPG